MSEIKLYELGIKPDDYVNQLRNATFALKKAIPELIDNSIDAGANQIKIYENNGNLVIQDNGHGFKDFRHAAFVGDSPQKNKNKMGRYGVGMKSAVIRYSEVTIIESLGKRMVMNWKGILEGMIDPIFEEEECDFIDGTKITLIGFSRLRSTHAVRAEDLAQTYAMLLAYTDTQITLNGEPLQVPEIPKYIDKIDEKVEWRGKRARVIGGTYPTNDPARRNWQGYYAYYNGRLIKGKILNCGRGDLSCSNFVYHIYMYDTGPSKWKLSTHKDEVHDLTDFIEHLYTTYTEDHLKKAEKESEFIELKEIQDFVTAAANGKVLRNSTRSKGGKQGTIERVGTGRRQINTNQHTCAGEYIPTNSGQSNITPSKIEFKFEMMEGFTLGMIDNGKGNKLNWKFNLNNQFVNKYKSDKRVIAPLVVCLNELFNDVNNYELFSDDNMDIALLRTGEHLDATVENYD